MISVDLCSIDCMVQRILIKYTFLMQVLYHIKYLKIRKLLLKWQLI